jgi:hypothetical protein
MNVGAQAVLVSVLLARKAELEAELEAGARLLQTQETGAARTREVILQIRGALQVLSELLAHESEEA